MNLCFPLIPLFISQKREVTMFYTFVLVLGLQLTLTLGNDDLDRATDVFDPSKVTFFLYRSNTRNASYQLFANNETNLLGANFDPRLNTFMFIHGYSGDHLKAQSQKTKEALLNVSDANVILADYAPYNSPYLLLFKNGKSIGNVCAGLINFLQAKGGLRLAKLTIIGHSFGAQISAFTANNVKGEIPLIVGLDPAGPLFRMAPPENRLSPDDATRVDCIHTSPVLGIHEAICTVNFFANGGANQPSCAGADDTEVLFGTCSHLVAVDYYAATLQAPQSYPASFCLSPLSAKNDNKLCVKTNSMFMHSSLEDRTFPGSYYVAIPSSS